MTRIFSLWFTGALLLSAIGCDIEKPVWLKMYGADYNDSANAVQQTSDNGYIVAGGEGSGGSSYLWVFKLNKNGLKQWTNTYDQKIFSEERMAIEQTGDGGYIVAATIYGGEFSEIYVTKLNSSGGREWSRAFGGSANYEAYDIHQTSDSGYIIAGLAQWYSDYHGIALKLAADGNREWEKSGVGYITIQQTNDGGYLTVPYDALRGIRNRGIVKLDPSGEIEWSAASDTATYGLNLTSDGGCVETCMVPGSDEEVYGGFFPLLKKRNRSGVEEWRAPLDTFPVDARYLLFYPLPAIQASDGGYLCAINVICDNGECSTICLRKLDAAGNETWSRYYNTEQKVYIMNSVRPARDGGFIVSGKGRRGVGYDTQALVMKFDEDGFIGSALTPMEF
ncbi:MAG: hypothetical protein JXA07_13140 [Spirochaetes bacterium]|nr:hypothetical protein [Spirochaetota bacterium]